MQSWHVFKVDLSYSIYENEIALLVKDSIFTDEKLKDINRSILGYQMYNFLFIPLFAYNLQYIGFAETSVILPVGEYPWLTIQHFPDSSIL